MKKRVLKFSKVLPVLIIFLMSTFSLYSQNTITGKVSDAKDGSGLPGVTITVRETKKSVQTDANGNYSIVAPANATLVATSASYGRKEIPIAGQTGVNISLNANNQQLNEVVVIGYGTTRKKDLTGSIGQVTSKDFQKGNIVTPEQLIAGKLPGVQVTSNGGAPGSGSTIRIRGGASLNATNDPLIVIDGVPLDNTAISGAANALNLINPNDIESFSVLKDASAAAIYGSRASNGVILITTKKGRTGKPVVNFNSTLSIAKLINKVDVLSASEFRNFLVSHGTTDNQKLLGAASTDWQDQIYQTAISSDNNLSVSGGYKNMPYRYSLGYLNQEGILKTGKLSRYSLGVNISPRFFDDHLKIDLNVKTSLSENRFANEGAIGAAVNYDPTKPVFSGNKRFGGYYEYLDSSSAKVIPKSLAPRNPVGLLFQRQDISEVRRSIGNAQIDYKLHFLPDLHLNLNLGYDASTGLGTINVPDSAASDYGRSSDGLHGGINNKYRQKKLNTLLEAYLNYSKDLKSINSRIDAVGGYAFQNFLTTTFNFPDYTADFFNISKSTDNSNSAEYTLISYYGRINYSYGGKYFLSGTIRADGSSKFNPDNRWSVFPSASVAWKIKEEGFLKNSNTFSDLKLRFGYGITGQQEGINYYDYISYYRLSNAQAQYQLGNTFYYSLRPEGYYYNRKWEQTATYNAGLDYGFANNRITGAIDYYYKTTTDLLNEITQSAGSNFSNKIVANVGSMTNSGVEVSFNLVPVKNRNVTWDISLNGTYNKNKITNLTISSDPNYAGNQFQGIAGGVGTTILINSVNHNRGSFYVYQQVYDANGKPIEGVFADRNRDGIINEKDLVVFKNSDPRYLFGASSNVSYRNWNAGFVLRANVGNYVYNNTYSSTGIIRNIINPLNYLNNGSRNVLETNFTGNGDKTILSDYYIQNASFLKLDNVNVGYSFGKIFNGLATVALNGTIQNVFVVTKYRGLDPEISYGVDNNFYPRPRTYSIGLSVGFR